MPLRLFSTALALAASLMLPAARAQFAPLPPSPSVRLAVDPILNKVYAANKDANTVTALDATTGTTRTIPVGGAPDFIAVDPTRGRVYVNNTRDASLTVIDGGTNTVIAPYDIGSMGPIAINPDPASARSVVYVVRMTGAGSDEVTYFSPGSPTWYTIATDSFQPTAVAVNPATHTIFVPHYATGDLRIINGEFNGNDFPHPPSRTMCDNASSAPRCSTSTVAKPFAVVANPVTNKTYVITEHATDSIAIVDGATLNVSFPAIAAGHATGPKALAVNPVTNKIYAAFANEVIVIDGATNALTYIPIAGASSGAISLGISYNTNRIYVATELGTLSIIDGATNTVESSRAIAAGTSSIGINPVTNTVYLYANGITALAGAVGTPQTIPLSTSITPLAGNSSGPTGSISLTASSGFAPGVLPVRKVYFRLDNTSGPWTEAPASASGSYTANFSSLPAGSHTLYAFAVDDQVAPLSTGPQSIPLVGQLASYSFTVTGSAATPSLSLVASANPSVLGDPVTFTASIAGNFGAPTGTISFLDGTSSICSAVALAGGSATCTTSTLARGSHAVSAQYSGDSSYASASASIAQVVKGPATLSLTSSANPSASGQSVTFTLAASGTAGTPSGSVTFKDGATTLCTVMLASGSAVCAAPSLAAGTHSVRADYAGDSNYVASSSNTVTQVVKAAATMTLSSSANPSAEGQAVTFTANVTGSAGTASGTVSFTDGGAPLSGCTSITLSSGTATCNATSLGTGARSIAAQYSGDSGYGAASASLTQTVNARGAPSLSIASSANPSNPGQSVTFTLTASGSSGPPTGAVTFKDGSTTLCSTTLTSGSASCAAASLTAGTHPIRADYAGDANYTAGSSNTVSQVVKSAATTTLSVSANPSTVGQSVRFTATVSGAPATPTGTVSFTDGGNAIPGCGTVALSGGMAVCTTTSLSAGTHSIVAQYAGDSVYLAATSSALSQSVSKAAVTVTLSSSTNPSNPGQPVTFTTTLSGSAGPVTGTVAFLDGGAAIAGCGSVAVTSGSTACTTGALSSGTHSITVQYAGDGNYAAGSSASLSQGVSVPPKANANVTLASAQNPSVAGDNVTFTASIGGASGAATGTVSFASDGSAIAGCTSIAVSGGSAACATSALSVGTHDIVAQYSGDATYNAATSASLGQRVESAPTPAPQADLGITISAPSSTAAGTDVAFSIVASNAGPAPASGVTVTQTLPAGTTFVSASSGCAVSAGYVSCTAGSLPAGTALTLQVTVLAAQAGTFNATASIAGQEQDPASANNTASASFTATAPRPPPKARLANISTRGQVLTGNDVMIGGFVVGGPSAKTVVVRALGPSLGGNVANPLANPTLTLVRVDGTVIATNDDWSNDANASQLSRAGFSPSDPREAALYVTLPPGAYGALVSGVNGATGVGLVEVYEVDHPEVPLINISTRGKVLTGDEILIGGFVVMGEGFQTVVVRGLGPSLANSGVAGALPNPTLQLVRLSDGATVAVNDDWQGSPDAQRISAAGLAPSNPLESAIYVTLPPGAYGALLSGVNGATGTGLVEVYTVE